MWPETCPGIEPYTHMEDGLVVPVWVDLGQLGGNPVVLPDHHQVDNTQHRLLVHSKIKIDKITII